MSKEAPSPTRAQVQSLIDRLLPPNDEMDTSSALVIIERSGGERSHFSKQLKLRLELKVDDLRSQGLEVPSDLLKVISVL